MDIRSVKQWLVLFFGILFAILVANALSGSIVLIAGVKGWPAAVVSFVLYAVFLFAVFYLMKRYAHIDIFRFDFD
jgi:uncharacterized integral membrane protein